MKDSTTSDMHEHEDWYKAWVAAAATARKQYFLVDDAFLESKNCMDEIQQYKQKSDKPAAFVFRGDTSRWSTASGSITKPSIETETDLFGGNKIEN